MTTDPALTLHQFWDLVLADTHPPIYYLVLRLSSAAFGQSEIAARVPSTFFGVLTVCGAAILSSSSLSRTSRLHSCYSSAFHRARCGMRGRHAPMRFF
jgi:uncharacterized membrane protein